MSRPIANADKKIRCTCRFCGVISKRTGERLGDLFIPKRKNQRFKTRKHYLRYLYNNKPYYEKICACGCQKYFTTRDPYRMYIKGHQKIFECSLCRFELEKGLHIIKKKK